MEYIFAQAVGLIAVTISLTIFQSNNRSHMLKLGMLASLFYAIHFLLLGAVTGAVMNLIGGTRSFVFFKFNTGKKRWDVLIIFIVLAVVGTIMTWQGPISLLAMGGSIGSSFAFWHTKPRHIRRWALLVPPLWFTYDAISGSIPGMLIEVIILCSNLVGEYRFDFRGKAHVRSKLARPA